MANILRFIVAIISVGIFSTSAMAVGIKLHASVDPSYLPGVALYDIGVTSDSPNGANVFSVAFEDDIFASVGTPSFISGAGGFDLSLVLSGGYTYVVGDGYIAGSGEIHPGESLRFSVAYILTDPKAFFYGTDPDHTPPLWTWDENASEPWNQSVGAVYLGAVGGIPPFGGTSTVPEPASIILIGSGLIGLGLLRKVRSK